MNKRTIYTIIQVILLVIVVYGLYRTGSYLMDERKQDAQSAQIAETVEAFREEKAAPESAAAEKPKTPAMNRGEALVKKLQETVPDAVGYLEIPDTILKYVTVQGENNEIFLDHDVDRSPSILGSIFLDAENTSDASDMHNILYGHNLRNGACFGLLREYKDPAYLAAHPQVVWSNLCGEEHYRIFAVFEADENSAYRELVQSEEDFNRLMEVVEASRVYAFEKPAYGKVLTLSTCTNPGERMVVMAIREKVIV